ncbi:Phosphatidylinositol-4-phosphate 5-kinase [Chytriomyces hyalinus]|nr:Phosphatidylinositol-4-phosphate 5-kinase [Chytriomyces hyalinus]
MAITTPQDKSISGSSDHEVKSEVISSRVSVDAAAAAAAQDSAAPSANLVKLPSSPTPRSESLPRPNSKNQVRPAPIITKKKSDVSSITSVSSAKAFSYTVQSTTPLPHKDSFCERSTISTVESPAKRTTPSTEGSALVKTLKRSAKEVLRGTPVKEGHVNYMLMYDMLTGIRVSVSRCNAKPMRDIMPEDFEAAHKIAFDVTGNEMAPTSRYDFKFKDYAPWIFRLIRGCFKVDPSEYLISLTGKYVLSELGSPGKSGSFFYFSQDFRFIIKTIHFSEHKFIRRVLKDYYEHVKANPDTLLSRIFGLHRVKLPGNKKIHFVVMGNVFPPNKDIHETYDLKGSTVGRLTPEEKVKKSAGTVLKDLNWVNRERKLFLGPIKREALVSQMEKDVAFLARMNIMDYSLLIGIHDLVKGNSDNLRDSVLSVIEPSPQDLSKHQNTNVLRRSTMKSSLQVSKRIVAIDVESIKHGPGSAKLPEEIPPERRFCTFYKEFGGGFVSTNELNEPLRDLYYVGIIDIFTEYNAAKKTEHFFKAIINDRHKISAVQPAEYAERFLAFMKAAINSNQS